jgi:hypothetical protein
LQLRLRLGYDQMDRFQNQYAGFEFQFAFGSMFGSHGARRDYTRKSSLANPNPVSHHTLHRAQRHSHSFEFRLRCAKTHSCIDSSESRGARGLHTLGVTSATRNLEQEISQRIIIQKDGQALHRRGQSPRGLHEQQLPPPMPRLFASHSRTPHVPRRTAVLSFQAAPPCVRVRRGAHT